jgi:type 1 fimbria pilin
MNRFALAVSTLLCLPSLVLATNHGAGRVQVRGSIIDTACAIDTGDKEQSIKLGTLPVSDLVNDGHGPEIPFTVHLVNCVLNGMETQAAHHWKDIRITFEGIPAEGELFALQGSARGEALAIMDESGTVAAPGEPMPATAIEPGSMTLHYRMRLKGDHNPLRPGSFATSLRYFMEYE